MDGSVSIQVSLDIDKSELENLEKSKLKKTVELEIDGKSLDKIEDRKLTFMGYLDSSAIEKELERLEQRGLSFKGKGGGGGGNGGGFDCCDDIVNAIEQMESRLTSALFNVQSGLISAIGSASKEQVNSNQEVSKGQQKSQMGRDIIGFLSSPLRSVTRGVFEGFGQGLSKSFTGQFVNSLEKELGNIFKKVGREFGEYVGKEVDKATGIGRKSPRERVIVTPPPSDTGESGGSVNPNPKPKAPTGGSGEGVTPEATRVSVEDIAKSRQFFQKSNREIGKARSVINRKEFNKPVTDKEIEETLETLRKGKLYARKVSNWIDETIKQLDNELAAMPRQKRIGSEQAMLKAQLVRTKSSVKDFERLQNQASKVGLGQAVSDGVTKGVDKNKAYKAGQDVGKSVEKGFTDETKISSPSKKFMGYGHNLIDGLIKGIIDKTPFACQAVKHTGKLLEKTIRDSFVTFGDNIFDGLSQGISAYIGEKGVGKIGKLIGTSLLSSVKKVLGIQSPSKEFKLVGKDVIKGFLVGLEGFEAPLATKVRIVLNYIKLIKDVSHHLGESLTVKDIPKLGYNKDSENTNFYTNKRNEIHLNKHIITPLSTRGFGSFDSVKSIDQAGVVGRVVDTVAHELTHYFQVKRNLRGKTVAEALKGGFLARTPVNNPFGDFVTERLKSQRMGRTSPNVTFSVNSFMEQQHEKQDPFINSNIKKIRSVIRQMEKEAYNVGNGYLIYYYFLHKISQSLNSTIKNVISHNRNILNGLKQNLEQTLPPSKTQLALPPSKTVSNHIVPQLEPGMDGGNKPPKPPRLLLPPASPDPNKLPELPTLTQKEIEKRYGNKSLPKSPFLSQKEIDKNIKSKTLSREERINIKQYEEQNKANLQRPIGSFPGYSLAVKQQEKLQTELQQDAKDASWNAQLRIELQKKIKESRERLKKSIEETVLNSKKAVDKVTAYLSRGVGRRERIKPLPPPRTQEEIRAEQERINAFVNVKDENAIVHVPNPIDPGWRFFQRPKVRPNNPFNDFSLKAMFDFGGKQKAKKAQFVEETQELIIERKKREKQADEQVKRGYKNFLKSPIDAIQDIFKGTRDRKSAQKEINRLEKQFATDAESVFDRVFRVIGVAIKRKGMKGVPPQERQRTINEAAGFVLAGATFLDLMAPIKLALAPLAMALSPLLLTLAGLNRVLGPLIIQFVETLKIIEPIQRRFASIVGSPAGGEREYKFASKVARQYNVPIQSSLEQYSKLLGAAKGTALEGQPLADFFEALSIAVKALGLSAQDTELVFYGFNNMVAKGKVQAEELRLQLAEKFPPTLGVFSRALKISQTELFDLVEKGALTIDEVLPKVTKQLKSEFGNTASGGVQQFIDGLTRVQNALFSIQEQLAKTFQPLLGFIGNLMASVAEVFEGQIPLLTQLGSVFAIGFGAQFLVGLQTAFIHGKIAEGLATVQVLLLKAFAGSMRFLAPFLIGIIADMFDNVLGADKSVFQNLTDTFKNLIISFVYLFDNIGSSIGGSVNWFSQLKDAIGGLTATFIGFVQSIPSGVVELVALTFILIQISALTKLYLIPAFTKFTLVFGAMFDAIKVAIASKGGLSGIWDTMTGGIKKSQIALYGLVALLFLMIAKSDILNELWMPLRKNNAEIVNNLNGITNAINNIDKSAKQASKSISELKFELPSKGLELNPFVLVGADSFKTDDLRKLSRNQLNKNQQSQDPSFLKDLTNLGLENIINVPNQGLLTETEKQLIQNSSFLKENNTNIQNKLKQDNLTPQTFPKFLTIDKQGIINDLKEIDNTLLQLGKKRSNFGLINTSKAKKEIGIIDNEILSLTQKRQEKAKVLAPVIQGVIDTKSSVEEQKKAIDQSSYSPQVKRALMAQLQPTIDAVNEAYKLLDKEGIVNILEPLKEKWKEVTDAIADATKAYEKFLRLSQINLLNQQTDITSQRFTPEEEAKQLGALELRDLKNRENSLVSITSERKKGLSDLLAIPIKSDDQKKQIEDLRTSVEQGELEIAQTRLNIAQKTAEQRKKIESDMLADLTRANKQAIAVIEQSTGNRVIKALEGQKAGKLSPQSADYLMGQAQSDSIIESSKQSLRALEQEALEYKKMRAMNEEDYQKNIGKVLSDKEIAMYAKKKDEKMLTEQEFVDKSIEVNKKLLETKQNLLREELKARQAARDEQIRQINEVAIANKTALGEQLKGRPVNLDQTEVALVLEDITAIGQAILVIGNSDPVKLRELNKQLNELENRLIAVLEAQKIARLDAEKFQQTKLSLAAKRVGLDTDAALIAAEAEKKYSDELIKVKKESLAEYERLNLSGALSDSQYAEKRRQLLGELRQAEQQNIEALINLEKARIDALVNNLERELKYRTDLQDLRNKELDDIKRIKEATNDLSKANSDLRISGNEGKISLIDKALEGFGESGQKAKERFDKAQGVKVAERVRSLLGVPIDPTSLLEERSRLEKKIAAEKFDALQQEMTLQREMLQLEQEQAITAKQRAIEEAEINKIKAEQLLLIARKAVLEAKTPEDKAIADKGLEIAAKGLELAGKQVATAQRGLQTEVEISNKKRESLQSSQTQQIRETGLGEILKNPESLPGFKMGTQAIGLPLIPRHVLLGETTKTGVAPEDEFNLNDLNNTYKSRPIPSFRESGMMVNYRPSYDDITPKYAPSMNQLPQFDINAILRSQEQILTKMMQRPTIDKVEVNNSFGDANTQKTFDEYRTQTLKDFNDVLEKKAGL